MADIACPRFSCSKVAQVEVDLNLPLFLPRLDKSTPSDHAMSHPQPHELIATAKKNGYKRGRYHEEDGKTNLEKYVRNTLRAHEPILYRYAVWHYNAIIEEHEEKGLAPPGFETVKNRVIGKNAPGPTMEEAKDFFRFVIDTSKGIVTTNGRPSAESMKTAAENFYRAFTDKTGTETDPKQHSEIYRWLKYVLPAQGILEDVWKPKRNFGSVELDRVLEALWCKLEVRHERARVQYHLLLMLFAWSGARSGALFANGITYKDIELVQRRKAGGDGYEFIWRFDQRYIKGNRNPENVALGTPGKDHPVLMYNTTGFLLSLAFADNALFGNESIDDLLQQEILEGETEKIYRWNDDVLNLPIVRAISKDGTVLKEALSESTFRAAFREILVLADYFGVAPSLHQLRRFLGKQIDDRYTEVERCQHIGQADRRIFGQSYVADCSSVDGLAAFLNETPDHSVSQYFQGLGRFYERGMPRDLPAARKLALERKPEVLELSEQVAKDSDSSSKNVAAKTLRSLRRKLYTRELESYREEWLRERRDWKILTRGKVPLPDDVDNAGQIVDLIPERQRIAQQIPLKSPLAREDMIGAIRDLCSLCIKGYSVVYYPGEEPTIDGHCQVCGDSMEKYAPRYRSSHAHGCWKKQTAKQRKVTASSLRFCYFCMDWFVRGEQWDEHCLSHLSQPSHFSPPFRACGTISSHNTLARPAYCPMCLAASDQSPSRRMRSWQRDADAIRHFKEEELRNTYPAFCHPCSVHLLSEEDVNCHLVDAHGFRFSSAKMASMGSRKRKKNDSQELDTPRKEGTADPEGDVKVSDSDNPLEAKRCDSTSPPLRLSAYCGGFDKVQDEPARSPQIYSSSTPAREYQGQDCGPSQDVEALRLPSFSPALVTLGVESIPAGSQDDLFGSGRHTPAPTESFSEFMSKCISLPPSPPQLQTHLAPGVAYYDLTGDDEIPSDDLEAMAKETTKDDYEMSRVSNAAPRILHDASSSWCAVQDRAAFTCAIMTTFSGVPVNGGMTRRKRDALRPDELERVSKRPKIIVRANKDGANGSEQAKNRPKLILHAKEPSKRPKLIMRVNGERVSRK